jgi:transglutaminase-like putative cysteine protease
MSEFGGTGKEPAPTHSTGVRIVSCELGFTVIEPTEVVLQLVAATSAGRVLTERLDVSTNGEPALTTVELSGPHGARVHLLQSLSGRLAISYRSEIDAVLLRPAEPLDPALDYARLVYLRPSRYCPSDHLVGFAVAEFGMGTTVRSRVEAISDWIRQRIGYVAGSSSVHDSAEDTLLTGMGTCRDFAHLGIALCRAIGVPARFVSVYAPGLAPMDFHAVFETLEDGRWITHDTTDLAPRQSLVRIATGRDAADAAFASVNKGIASLHLLDVTATVDGDLPADDPRQPVELA